MILSPSSVTYCLNTWHMRVARWYSGLLLPLPAAPPSLSRAWVRWQSWYIWRMMSALASGTVKLCAVCELS